MQHRRRLLSILLLLGLIVSLFTGTAFSNPEETRKEIAELEKVIAELKKDISDREKRIVELNAALKESEARLEQTKLALAESEANLAEKNAIFGERVRTAYMAGSLSYLDVLFDAENFGDLILRFVYMTRILNRDAEIVSSLREEYAVLQERKLAMETEQERLTDLRYQVEAEHKNLVAQEKEMQKLLAAAQGRLADEMAASIPQAEVKPVYGVVIDNHAAARPQHGLSQANVVYEYEVEGRITRYLALFASFPGKVGPLRSARQHNITLALENGVRFIHAGGSYDNLQLIKDLNLRHTDALTSSNASFYRDKSRRAPHNLYVNLQQLKEEAFADNSSTAGLLSRQGKAGNALTINYSGNYKVSCSMLQIRAATTATSSQQHRDDNGAAIQAKILLYSIHRIIMILPAGHSQFNRRRSYRFLLTRSVFSRELEEKQCQLTNALLLWGWSGNRASFWADMDSNCTQLK